MKIDVFFSPAEVAEAPMESKVAAVIDVIRATSTMVEALANGARGIFPTVSTEEAIKLASSLGREDTILCGERKGLKVEGFDLGNSPSEFTTERVQGKQLVMSTTNGTRAFLSVAGAHRVLAASFLNLSAVAEALQGTEEVAIVCAGKEDRFALDDALCAGNLIEKLVAGEEADVTLNDAGRVALELSSSHEVSAEFLQSTAAGRALEAVGLEEDLEHCAALDRYSSVPEMKEKQIGLPGEKKES
jgi:2-phosphosulfolactate phosphatase